MPKTQMDARNSLRGKAPDYETLAKNYKDAAKIKAGTDRVKDGRAHFLRVDITEKVKSCMLTGSAE